MRKVKDVIVTYQYTTAVNIVALDFDNQDINFGSIRNCGSFQGLYYQILLMLNRNGYTVPYFKDCGKRLYNIHWVCADYNAYNYLLPMRMYLTDESLYDNIKGYEVK